MKHGAISLLLAIAIATNAKAGEQSVVVIDLANGKPATRIRVRVQSGDRVDEMFTSDKGELILRTGETIQIESSDPAWKVLPGHVRVDEKLKTLAAHRFITVEGQVTARRIRYLDETDIFVTFVDPNGKDRNIGSGGAWVHPWGIRTVFRAGIPNQKGRFTLRLPAVRGLALFARLENHLTSIRRVALEDQNNLTLAMSPGLVVQGKVTDEAGQPIPNALVRMDIVLAGIENWYPESEAKQRFGGGAIGAGRSSDGRIRFSNRYAASTGEDGRFQLISPTDGDCVLTVFAKGYLPNDRNVFWLDAAQRNLKFKMSSPESARLIPVLIDGKTKPGAEMLVLEFYPAHRPIADDITAIWSFNVTLDDDGRLPTEWFREGNSYSISTNLWKLSTGTLNWPVRGPIKLRKDKH